MMAASERTKVSYSIAMLAHLAPRRRSPAGPAAAASPELCSGAPVRALWPESSGSAG